MLKVIKGPIVGLAASSALLFSLVASTAEAAEAEVAQAAAGEIEEVVVVGSRRRDRSAAGNQ